MGMNVNVVKGGLAIAPLTYHAAVTVDDVGKTLALNPSTSKVFIYNTSAAAGIIYVVFGTSAANAVINLGISSNVATKGIPIINVTGNSNQNILSVPNGATHIAYATATTGVNSSIIVVEGQ